MTEKTSTHETSRAPETREPAGCLKVASITLASTLLGGYIGHEFVPAILDAADLIGDLAKDGVAKVATVLGGLAAGSIATHTMSYRDDLPRQ